MNLLDKIAYDTGGYTVQEILSSFCKKIIEIIDLVNKNEEVCDEAHTLIENIRNEVVPPLVEDIMKELQDSGYFDSLVNVTLIDQLRTELTTLLNQTITEYTTRLDSFDSQLDINKKQAFQNFIELTGLKSYESIAEELDDNDKSDNEKYENFINSHYEVLRNKYSDYITRTILGKDSSGTMNLYQYDFKPRNPKSKIILFGGTHGMERMGIFALFEEMQIIANARDNKCSQLIQKLREDVHFVVIPVLCPYGFVNYTYWNANGVNLNRNYPHNWYAQTPQATTTPFEEFSKGTAPFSEPETQYADRVLKENVDAICHFDYHSTNNHNFDWYYIYVDDCENKEILQEVLDFYVEKRKRECLKESKGTEIYWEAYHATVRQYCYGQYGIPSTTMEWQDGSWNGVKNSAEETTIATEWFLNHIIHHYEYYKDKKRKPLAQIPRINKVGGLDVEKNNFENIESFLEPLREANSSYISRRSLGKDQSGNYDVWCYELRPYNYDKTILIFSGLSGLSVNAPLTAMQSIKAIVDNVDGEYGNLRWNTRILFVPIVNPYGQINKTLGNSRGVALEHNFDYKWQECTSSAKGTSAFSEVETQYLRDLAINNNVDFILWYDKQLNTGFSGISSHLNKYHYILKMIADKLDKTATQRIGTEDTCNPVCYFNSINCGIPSFQILFSVDYWHFHINSVLNRTKNMNYLLEVLNALCSSLSVDNINNSYFLCHVTKGNVTFGKADKIINEYSFTIPAQSYDGVIEVNGYVTVNHNNESDNVSWVTPIIFQGNNYDLDFFKDKYGNFGSGGSGVNTRITIPFICKQTFKKGEEIKILFNCNCSQAISTSLQRMRCVINLSNKNKLISKRIYDNQTFI